MKNLKLTFDPKVNAAYLKVRTGTPVTKTVQHGRGDVLTDHDAEGNVVGVEVLDVESTATETFPERN